VNGDGILTVLVADLARAQSGIEFIYNVLDRVMEANQLRDAVVIIAEPSVGRQVFRAGRRPPNQLIGGADPFTLPPGLYTTPDLVSSSLREAVANLCLVGLQLDLSRHDAAHDPLTGLYNRRSFDAMLHQSAVRSARYGWRFIFSLCDIDRFKLLNDQFGHEAGDQILRVIGSELRSSLRGGDAAARIGGDEFALILHNGDQRVLGLIVDRVQASVANAVGVEVGFSTGSASAPDESSDPGAMYRVADERLYENKRAKVRS
jgi:diguanylate cyclase (GGDEF)-like protein